MWRECGAAANTHLATAGKCVRPFFFVAGGTAVASSGDVFRSGIAGNVRTSLRAYTLTPLATVAVATLMVLRSVFIHRCGILVVSTACASFLRFMSSMILGLLLAALSTRMIYTYFYMQRRTTGDVVGLNANLSLTCCFSR